MGNDCERRKAAKKRERGRVEIVLTITLLRFSSHPNPEMKTNLRRVNFDFHRNGEWFADEKRQSERFHEIYELLHAHHVVYVATIINLYRSPFPDFPGLCTYLNYPF
jgi:hypothetical protein